jgi:hypothetical protein
MGRARQRLFGLRRFGTRQDGKEVGDDSALRSGEMSGKTVNTKAISKSLRPIKEEKEKKVNDSKHLSHLHFGISRNK